MEKGEICYIISIPFNAISWSSSSYDENFRLHVSSISQSSNGEEQVTFDVSLLNESGSTFVDQPSKGIQYTNDYFLFKSLTKNSLSGIRIEFIFNDAEDKPKVSSFTMFEEKSPGLVQSPIVDTELNVLGTIKIYYLIVKPYPFELDHESCPKFNIFLKKAVHAGHRGAGAGRRKDLSDNILENTILSLNYAIKHGADMVEFDVHLSKDDVPILYHDFSVNVSLTKKGSTDIETLELPVKDLTYQQLKMLKLKPARDNDEQFEFVDDTQDNQPFCTLEHALNTVTPCAFNVEVKYPTGSGFYKDLNHFVDTILKTIFEHHNNRPIIFSSFDPDVCAMINLKQKKIPVLFLTYTEDRDVKMTSNIDDRMDSVEMACYYSSAMSFAGVNCYAQNLITDKSLVKYVINKGLLLFCYGGSINTSSIVEDLIKEGVHGVIYDKIDIISPKKLLASTTAASTQAGDTPVVRKTSATIFSVDSSS